MGQSASVEKGGDFETNSKGLSKESILQFYNHKAIKQFTPPELFSFKNKICKDTLTTTLSDEDIIKWLKIPTDNGVLIGLILNMIRVLSNFPFINSPYNDIDGVGLLKTILLLDKERCSKFVGDKMYDQLTLLFISLALNHNKRSELQVKSETETENLEEKVTISEVVKTYDHIPLEVLAIDNKNMLQFIIWILTFWRYVPRENSLVDLEDITKEWGTYKVTASNILKTISYDPSYMDNSAKTLTKSDEVIKIEGIKHWQFINTITTFLPNLLLALSNSFKHLLYRKSELQDHSLFRINFDETKLMTNQLMAQLTLMIPPTKFPITKIQKLYVGRESGFSMRSLQSKVFKWLAPSILLVSGMRIIDDTEYITKNNPRYGKFLEGYRKLKDEDQTIDKSFMKKKKVTFAICIKEPWRVTNKDLFSGPDTTIYQLSPWIDIYKAKKSNIMYFNTANGGIGIGNEQPTIKTKCKTYHPGNVSLTLDDTLEFGVFRHIGLGGGTIDCGMIDNICPEEYSDSKTPTFEMRFLIQDVEIWGCGGEKELAEQLKQLEWEEAEAKRRQHINLKSLGEDRALLEMAGLVGQHQSGGSM